jgi:hypothetical protein
MGLMTVLRARQFVYLIRIGNRYKIGRTIDPSRRLSEMQLPEEPEILFWHAVQDSKKSEGMLHRMFATKRKHGEWFELSDSDVYAAEDCLALELWR